MNDPTAPIVKARNSLSFIAGLHKRGTLTLLACILVLVGMTTSSTCRRHLGDLRGCLWKIYADPGPTMATPHPANYPRDHRWDDDT
jgi:hypothetical protein